MAILLRTRAASAFLLPFRRQLYFPVAARALSTSKIASFRQSNLRFVSIEVLTQNTQSSRRYLQL